VNAAIVVEAGKAPIYDHFEEPVPAADEVRVTVSAAALSTVVKSRASGKHYSSSENLPFVVGIDGVGRLDDGHRVHFVLPKAPFGSMSEQTVAASQCVALPDGLDDVIAAAIANPGMSAWAAFRERAKMAAGEIVLVNGATGTAGRFALQIAKHIGAKKVIATGRSMEALKALKTLEADVTIPLGSTDDEFEDDSTAELMLFWTISGEKARGGLSSRAQRQGRKSYRSVSSISGHIGSVSSPNITLPSAALRS
jgi:NADPH:quinone reductase-like Zn-dependent oxidoreductase